MPNFKSILLGEGCRRGASSSNPRNPVHQILEFGFLPLSLRKFKCPFVVVREVSIGTDDRILSFDYRNGSVRSTFCAVAPEGRCPVEYRGCFVRLS